MILKTLWAHRKQNGFVFAEIALITVLSFYMLDHIVVWAYGRYFCSAAGEFEKKHLVVAQTARTTPITAEAVQAETEAYTDTARLKPFEKEALKTMASLYAFRDEIRALPEVQSVCLTQYYIGYRYRWWNHHAMAPEADTAHICRTYSLYYILGEHYFETMGIIAIDGSPSAEVLSRDCPEDGVVITRSLARQLFGTDEAVGRRMVLYNYKVGPDNKDIEYLTHHTVAGVVEDTKPAPHERYCYLAFFPQRNLSSNTPLMVIRLKPETDAEAFVSSHRADPQSLAFHGYTLAAYDTYLNQIKKDNRINDNTVILTLLGTLGLLFALNVVLGTLGTYWLQIRKRTEDFGIMRSFGAKRRHIFQMVWGEGALLTLAACIVGQFIWLQFAVNYGLADGNIQAKSELETDWVTSFWLHYLVVCVIQYLLLLAIVTLGILVPSLIAMYKKPVDALHHE